MSRTENQTTTWSGVAAFSTHAPISTPPMRGGYPYGSAPKTAGPSHNLTAIIGATFLAVLMIVMAAIAVQRSNDAVVAATVVATTTAPQQVVVPHGALPVE